MKSNRSSNIALAITIAALLPLGFTPYLIAQTETSTSLEGGFADVQIFQDDNHIVMTVTKAGAEGVPEEQGAPVVVQPEGNDSGVVVVPVTNDTGEEPAPSEDVVIIEPNGNVTEVEGNVTNIDNSTVIVAPDNQTVTETPGDVIVIDPPACGCPSDQPQESTAPTETTNETEVITIEPMPSESDNTTSSSNDTGGAGFLQWLQELAQ